MEKQWIRKRDNFLSEIKNVNLFAYFPDGLPLQKEAIAILLRIQEIKENVPLQFNSGKETSSGNSYITLCEHIAVRFL